MEEQKQSAPIRAYNKYLKSKLFFSRIMGLIFCLICAGALTLMYFKILDKWITMVVIAFAMACIFIANSFLQNVKAGRKWQVINLILALVCYAGVVTFVTLGFIEGTIKLWF